MRARCPLGYESPAASTNSYNEIEMKSNKQRRLEIKAKRKKKKEDLKSDSIKMKLKLKLNYVEADLSQLTHNSYVEIFSPSSFKYWDKPFKCRVCGKFEIWTAKQQKWWYETAKGLLDSTAVHCKTCRAKLREEKEQHKKYMAEVAKRKPHPNEEFFRKRY